jgi:hypothetical protein
MRSLLKSLRGSRIGFGIIGARWLKRVYNPRFHTTSFQITWRIPDLLFPFRDIRTRAAILLRLNNATRRQGIHRFQETDHTRLILADLVTVILIHPSEVYGVKLRKRPGPPGSSKSRYFLLSRTKGMRGFYYL